jgi:hypothetical protein
VIQWLHTGFGLVIGFIGRSDTKLDYTLQFTITHTVSTATSSLALVWQRLPTADVALLLLPNSPRPQLPASHSNSSQWLNISSPLTNSPTYQRTNSTQLTITNCPHYNISACTAQKTPFHYCCAIVAVETCLFAKPLHNNSCCIVASSAIVA